MSIDQIISDYGLIAAYVLTLLAALGAIVLPLIKSIDNPKSLLGTLLGLAFLAVLFVIGYALAGNEVKPNYINFNVDEGISKVIGGVLTMFYLLFGLSILSILFTEVSKFFK